MSCRGLREYVFNVYLMLCVEWALMYVLSLVITLTFSMLLPRKQASYIVQTHLIRMQQ